MRLVSRATRRGPNALALSQANERQSEMLKHATAPSMARQHCRSRAITGNSRHITVAKERKSNPIIAQRSIRGAGCYSAAAETNNR